MDKVEANALAQKIIQKRKPSSDEAQYDPKVAFLDPVHRLTREEIARTVALGDRTAISYEFLADKVIAERGKTVKRKGANTSKTADFFLLYALAARDSKQIAHTSIREQVNTGADEWNGDSPITIQGHSVLAQLRDICSGRHLAVESLSSRGALYPEGYHRVPPELVEAGIGNELAAINMDIEAVYRQLVRDGLRHYLQTVPVAPEEEKESWKWEWRVLSHALDDARQVTNQMSLNQMSVHPNSALALGELVADLSASELPETREIAADLRKLGEQGLPTLMKYSEASPYRSSLAAKRLKINHDLGFDFPALGDGKIKTGFKGRLVENSGGIGRLFLAAMLADGGDFGVDYYLDRLGCRSDRAVGAAIAEIFEGMSIHDKPPKSLEFVQVYASFLMSVGAIYEAIRHRPATHIIGRFTPYYGHTTPKVYEELGITKEYREGVDLNERAFQLIANLGPSYERVYGPYAVARAHLVPYSLRIDGVDLWHFIKLRASKSAHPDISAPAQEFAEFLRKQGGVFKFLP